MPTMSYRRRTFGTIQMATPGRFLALFFLALAVTAIFGAASEKPRAVLGIGLVVAGIVVAGIAPLRIRGPSVSCDQ
jgi:hypothetical protein